jgi:hypothetical protein
MMRMGLVLDSMQTKIPFPNPQYPCNPALEMPVEKIFLHLMQILTQFTLDIN